MTFHEFVSSNLMFNARFNACWTLLMMYEPRAASAISSSDGTLTPRR
jgi:hypothetical protein